MTQSAEFRISFRAARSLFHAPRSVLESKFVSFYLHFLLAKGRIQVHSIFFTLVLTDRSDGANSPHVRTRTSKKSTCDVDTAHGRACKEATGEAGRPSGSADSADSHPLESPQPAHISQHAREFAPSYVNPFLSRFWYTRTGSDIVE